MFSKGFKVVHFKIHSNISSRITDKLFNVSQTIIRQRPSLVAVSINSDGGSITQAKNIVSILKDISYKTSAPIYTFGEDRVFGAANIVLVGANRCFSSKHSMIGQFGFSQIITETSEFNKEYGIATTYCSEATKGKKLDSNTPFTEEDKKWINNVLSDREEELKKELIKLRAEKFHEKNLSNEQLNSSLFQKDIVFGQEAQNLGFIDGVATFEQIVNTEFPDAKVKLVVNRRLFGYGDSAYVPGIFDYFSPLALQVMNMKV
ncbi:peptidase family S49 protein (macronuclear) [Tetrahymena thermophila SB210]|uniref:Peptidase family S49 protein n=1 Tax=Tetrahymena thermophila (strain SB210) TaxID=312017 RepID=I7M8K9_TETTS|nr:peptidase family S49 protein [Tetrahymena thermophila SB210]EAR98377.2 peptidase family S49 protein [Tetrahymena thermophila SB210]|eukprot:XP_001018622.2 peptidase family S49 protein [Tetrahymena thermophila SB210]